MTWEDIHGRKYDSIDRCIYCGSDGSSGGLRDEQIVPYSLGGIAALRKASCRACEAITSRVELYLVRAFVGGVALAGMFEQATRFRPSRE